VILVSGVGQERSLQMRIYFDFSKCNSEQEHIAIGTKLRRIEYAEIIRKI
jgi:hypothetical protein